MRRGEIFGLLGPNGAGKTTTFRMLCGLLEPSGGELHVAGANVRDTPASARARLGYVAQKFSLYGPLSVIENLEFFSSAYGLRGERRRERIDWAMAQFELGALARAPSVQLPGGYKQRLAMAAALLHEPEILFLDEPTSGADPRARRAFWRRITALAEQGVTIIVTTHFMQEAEYCDHVAIMDAGEILAHGSPGGSARTGANRGDPRAERWMMPSLPWSSALASVLAHRRVVRRLFHRRQRDGTLERWPSKLRRIRALVSKETRQIVRDPSSIAIGVVLPLLLILLFGYGLSLDVKNVPIAVVIERTYAGGGRARRRLSTLAVFSSLDDARDAAGAGAAARAPSRRHRAHPRRLLPPLRRRGCRGAAHRPRRRCESGADHSGLRSGRRRSVDGAAGGARDERAQARRWACRPAYGSTRPMTASYFLVPGLMVLVMTLIGGLLTAMVMAREWERGTLESLFVTPVRSEEILLGKTMPVFRARHVRASRCACCPRSSCSTCRCAAPCGCCSGARCSTCWSALGIGLLISSGGQEPARREPADDARHLHAGVHAVGLPVRPAQHAARRCVDHLRCCRRATTWRCCRPSSWRATSGA